MVAGAAVACPPVARLPPPSARGAPPAALTARRGAPPPSRRPVSPRAYVPVPAQRGLMHASDSAAPPRVAATGVYGARMPGEWHQPTGRSPTPRCSPPTDDGRWPGDDSSPPYGRLYHA
eukprot:Transcript_28740.p3 GENE.Transcript_28740~~Transcript_28740.p3  ORF type:complete len:119 (-),score=18.51 Transcript_28740:52-408(-)